MNQSDELPVFPTSAPEVFADRGAASALFGTVLAHLADIVDVGADQLDGATPCRDYRVGELRRHVLAWLQFFVAALTDPEGTVDRLDPETWELDRGVEPGPIVARAATDIGRAIDGGVAGRLVVMSQARMAGDGVLAMALGEYLVHGWDLAVATGRPWPPTGDDAGAEAALTFLRSTVAPEHRGPDSGFFGAEVAASADASPFERLLCFAGRQPSWAPSALPLAECLRGESA